MTSDSVQLDGLWKPLQTYYCHAVPRGMGVYLLLASVFWLFLLFQGLGNTAENFFSPILTQLSQDLGLPPRFAGVTFLALGNGAPDLSSTIAAIRSGDYNLSLGALTGAGMFVGTVVAGSCIMTAGGAKCRGALVRDVLGYAVAVLVIVVFAFDGKVNQVEVVVLLVLYVSFVLIVLWADLWHRLVHLKRYPPVPDVVPTRRVQRTGQDVEMTATPEDGSPNSGSDEEGSSRRCLASCVICGCKIPSLSVPSNMYARARAGSSQATAAAASSIDYAHMPAARYRDIAWATLAKSTSFFKRAASLKDMREQLFRSGALSASVLRMESTVEGSYREYQQVESIVEVLEEDEGNGVTTEDGAQRLLQSMDESFDGEEGSAWDGRSTYRPPADVDGVTVMSDATVSTPTFTHPSDTSAALQVFRAASGAEQVTSSAHSLSSWRPSPDRHAREDQGPVWAQLVSQPEVDASATVWARPQSKWAAMGERVCSLPLELLHGVLMEPWEEIQEASLLSKALMALLLPLTVAQRATVPIIVAEAYSQPWLVLSVAICPIWMMYSLGLWDSSAGVWAVVLLGGVVLAAVAGAFSQKDVPPEWNCGSKILFGAALMCTIGFVLAASWIAFVAGELVAMLQFFGYLSGVDSAALGLTVLAWGNSIGDLSTNMSMAKRGLSNMALTACFAGPLFNLLVGCAVGFMLWLEEAGTTTVSVGLSTPILVGGLFIILNCVSLVTIGLSHGRKVPRNTCYWMFSLYGMYVMTSLGLLFFSGK